jgi:hypothetical protein
MPTLTTSPSMGCAQAEEEIAGQRRQRSRGQSHRDQAPSRHHHRERHRSPTRGVSAAVWQPAGRMRLVRTALDGVLQIVVVALGASLGREGAPERWLRRSSPGSVT